MKLFLLLLPFLTTSAFHNIYKFKHHQFFHNRKNNLLNNNQDTGNDSEKDDFDEEIFNNDQTSMNRIVRLGRSKDQDGKSNIWSVEPRMEVIEQKPGDISDGNKNIVVGGLVATGIIFSLPFLYLLNSILPDPNNY
jgi:hypothetical protein